MIKKSTLITAGLSLLFCFSSMQAQQVLTIDGIGKADKNICQVSVPENMQLKKFGNRNVMTYKDVKTDNAEEEVNFTFKGICGNEFMPSQGCLYNKQNIKNIYFDSGSKESSETMPAGVYDAYMYFYDMYDMMYVIVKENVEITEGTVVEFDVSEAVNSFTFNYYDENGQGLYCDRYNTSFIKEEDGTVADFDSNIMLCHKDYGTMFIIMSQGYYLIGHEEAFFINTPGDKYYVGAGTCATKPDFTKYVFKNLVTEFKTQTIVNDPANLVYREATMVNTPVAKDDYSAHYPHNTITIITREHDALTQNSYFTDKLEDEYRTFRFWLDTPMSDPNDDIEFDVLYKPAYNDYNQANSWGGTDRFAVKAPGYIGNKQTGVILFNNGTDEYYAYSTTPEYEYGRTYPCHPDLSFEAEEHITFGNSAPVCSFVPAFYKEGNNISGYMKANYIGRFGESYDASKELVKSTSSMNEIEGGKMEIFVPNYNVEVDEMEGENITRMVFDPNGSDFITPTMHMLSVIDENGKVNDHLTSVKGAKIIMTGADYDYTYDPETWFGYFTYKDAAVELYYTVNGYEDDWKKLDVNVVPEKLFEPTYGNFYEVSLEGAEITEPESWLDLKIVITDEAGNFQEQIIRPVIYVENTSTGVESVRQEDGDIIVVNNTIRISGNNNGIINVYTIDGMNVMTSDNGVMNIENLKPGVYVVKVKTADASFSRKFVKK